MDVPTSMFAEGFEEGYARAKKEIIEMLLLEKTEINEEKYRNEYQRSRDLAIDRAIQKIKEMK